jgi:hypothetical protein
MALRKLSTLVMLLIAVAAPCGGEHNAAIAARAATTPSLTWKQLQNGTYPAILGPRKTVTLHNGTYTHNAGYDKYFAELFKVHAFGDLNGDKVPDAVVTLVENGGGTGYFFTLIAVLDKGGKPFVAATASLGDRPLVKSLSIAHAVITLKMVYAGPHAGACCPDTPTTLTFALKHGKLKLLKQVDGHVISNS